MYIDWDVIRNCYVSGLRVVQWRPQALGPGRYPDQLWISSKQSTFLRVSYYPASAATQVVFLDVCQFDFAIHLKTALTSRIAAPITLAAGML